MAKKLRPAMPDDLARIKEALARLREARRLMREAGAPLSTAKIGHAIKSAEGAMRHAERRRDATIA